VPNRGSSRAGRHPRLFFGFEAFQRFARRKIFLRQILLACEPRARARFALLGIGESGQSRRGVTASTAAPDFCPTHDFQPQIPISKFLSSEFCSKKAGPPDQDWETPEELKKHRSTNCAFSERTIAHGNRRRIGHRPSSYIARGPLPRRARQGSNTGSQLLTCMPLGVVQDGLECSRPNLRLPSPTANVIAVARAPIGTRVVTPLSYKMGDWRVSSPDRCIRVTRLRGFEASHRRFEAREPSCV
jgi:hypothetical protein